MHFGSRHFGGRHFAARHFATAVADTADLPWEFKAAPGTEVKEPPKAPVPAVASPEDAPEPATREEVVAFARRMADALGARLEVKTPKQRDHEAERRDRERRAEAAALRAQIEEEEALILSGQFIIPIYRAWRAQRLDRHLPN